MVSAIKTEIETQNHSEKIDRLTFRAFDLSICAMFALSEPMQLTAVPAACVGSICLASSFNSKGRVRCSIISLVLWPAGEQRERN
jgi:hypothetical protein